MLRSSDMSQHPCRTYSLCESTFLGVSNYLNIIIYYVQSKQGFYYPVNFGLNNHLRKYFAPMNGEIKPDSEEVRLLLRDSGWLNDDGALTGNR